MAKKETRELSPDLRSALLTTLKARFEKNKKRHKSLEWADVEARLIKYPVKLWSLYEMERTGGEPDVVDFNASSGEFVFFDCAAESPKDRRSLCYDLEAWESRKDFKPSSNAMDMASEMGIDILTEEQYHFLQKLGSFDLKTSSWLNTPQEIRKLGGAIFGDYRFGRVFIYHNGASSYYAARGFRGALRV
jgi:hypothetical protein